MSLVIGVDGLGYGQRGLEVADTPNIDGLMDGTWAEGYRSAVSEEAVAGGFLGTSTEQRTISGPGWSTILTGVWVDQHNVTDNNFSSPNLSGHPTYLEILEETVPDFYSATVVNWTPIDTHLISTVDDGNSRIDFRSSPDSDEGVMFTTSSQLASLPHHTPSGVFIQFDDVDIAGHRCGGSGACYQESIEWVDLQVGRLLSTITRRHSFSDEDWQVVLVSDHGHRPSGGHGGQSALERRIPFVVSSQQLSAGRLEPSSGPAVSHADVAPTVLEHFGIEVPHYIAGASRAAGSDVIAPVGQPVELFSEDFESLALERSPEEDPNSEEVWTKTPPSGWTVVDQVPGQSEPGSNNGVEDWIGWNFANKEWWTDVAEDQRRSEFVFGEGTVAIADPDEWDDEPHPDSAAEGWFNTWMTTPSIDLSGVDSSSVVLEFDSSWRPEFDDNYHQTANIQVAFDGGEDVEVLRWESHQNSPDYKGDATNERVRLSIEAPDHAESMVLTFGLFDAGNDWWWAIDNVLVSGERAGDFNGDGVIDDADIDFLTAAIVDGDPSADLNNDARVDLMDRTFFVEAILQTSFGDADLDGRFNSSDLVRVFLSGRYESEEAAGWGEGDWNGDGLFSSSDLVAALADGAYQAEANAATVPEPEFSSLLSIVLGLFTLRIGRRRTTAFA